MGDNSKEVAINPESEQPRPLQILLIEDEIFIVPVIEAMLEGHTITHFTNGEEALVALNKAKQEGRSFDWVITDWGLAGKMDGFDLADVIQKEQLGNPYVTMITG